MAPDAPPVDLIASPANLKARFKLRCEGTGNMYQNWQVRVHRALSWHKRAIELPADQPEARFLYLWIALSSLYSRWDAERNAPGAEHPARLDFLRRLTEMDKADRLAQVLRQNRPLVKKLLSNPFLSNVFWREPTHPKARGRGTEEANYLEKNMHDHAWGTVLDQALDRLYVLRGQIVHGASSGGSRLNRTSVSHCLMMLEGFMPPILEMVIEGGANDDWPDLCYPPIK